MKKLAAVQAALRTARVWVDRRDVALAYAVTDEDGFPEVKRPEPTFGTSDNADAVKIVSSHCHSEWVGDPARRFLDYCAATVSAAHFPTWQFSAERPDISVTTPPADATVPLRLNFDGLDTHTGLALAADVGAITFVAPPAWYEPDLREEFGDSRGWLPRLTVPRTDTLLTLPTHPVYAGEGFDVMVFNQKNFSLGNGGGPIDSFVFRVTYNATVVSPTGTFRMNGGFENPYLLQVAPGELYVNCSGIRKGVTLDGFVWLFTLGFAINDGLFSPGRVDTTIQMYKARLSGGRGNALGDSEVSTLSDYGAPGAGLQKTSARMELREPRRVALLVTPDPADAVERTLALYGDQFNYRTYPGDYQEQVVNYVGTALNDDDRWAPESGKWYAAADLATCTRPDTLDGGTTANAKFALRAAGGRCVLRLDGESTSGSAAFVAGDGFSPPNEATVEFTTIFRETAAAEVRSDRLVCPTPPVSLDVAPAQSAGRRRLYDVEKGEAVSVAINGQQFIRTPLRVRYYVQPATRRCGRSAASRAGRRPEARCGRSATPTRASRRRG